MYLNWPGFNERGAVIIELSAEYFCLAKNTIVVHDDVFTPKEELHITLIGRKLGWIIEEKIKQNQKINKLLKKIFEAIDWSFKQTGPIHILSRSKGAKLEMSIIMLIEMHGVTQFYQQLKASGLIDAKTPVPPAHVTMYTHNCPSGIGLPSDETLNRLSKKTLSLNTLAGLCKQVT